MLLQWQNGLHFIDPLWCHIVNDVDDRAFRRSIFCELQQFTKATYCRTDSVITSKLATVTYKAGGRDSRRFFPTASTNLPTGKKPTISLSLITAANISHYCVLFSCLSGRGT